MPAFPFPQSSTPGSRPGEGEGRYVNCYPVKEGDRSYVRRVPGLARVVATGKAGPLRGFLDVNGVIYAVFVGSVVRVAGTTVTTLSGSIPGADGVTLARNNRTTGDASTPDVIAVRESGGVYVLTASAVHAYPDADLPSTANSVDFMGGYLLFTLPDGRLYASELNSTAVNALSVTTAEARADGLKRVVVHGNIAYAFGGSTIEPYNNVGTMPFPLQRAATVLPIGLLTTMAVAGYQEAWGGSLYFVASDKTVRALSGYETATISTPDVERFIAGSTVATIGVDCFVWNGRQFIAVSSASGTWVYDVAARSWHERQSTGTARWRATRSIYSGDRWLFGDVLSGDLTTISAALTENGAALGGLIQSGPLKEFPLRTAAKLSADFTEAEAAVQVSWSHDGGKSFGTELTRSLANCERWPVAVSNLGSSTHHGVIVRFRWDHATDFAFMGATADRMQAKAA